MEKHHLLEAIPCNPIVFGEYKKIIHPRLMGENQIFLELKAVLVSGCGLINRLEPALLKQLTGLEAITHNTLDI